MSMNDYGNDFDLQRNMVKAGDEADFDAEGKKADSTAFNLVQKDKHLHDVKFTTKPTTFFKDAMRRFAKDKSSVTGGIILGILFLLALILPVAINGKAYTIDQTHAYEINLPPKLFAAGTGWWDGTRTEKNTAYPYSDDPLSDADDADRQYIGKYPTDDSILEVNNIRTGYSAGATRAGEGGFVKLNSVPNEEEKEGQRYLYHSKEFNYNEKNTYTLTYTLGSTEDQALPTYGVLFFDENLKSDDPLGRYVHLTESQDYGDVVTEKLNYDDGQTVYEHQSITLNLNDLFKAYKEKHPKSNVKMTRGRLGLYYISDGKTNQEFYVHDFTITSSSSRDRRQLKKMSFTDADQMMMSELAADTAWSGSSADKMTVVDVKNTTCDIVYDMYERTYGISRGSQDLGITVAQSTFDDWIKKGYIDFDYQHPTIGTPLTVHTEVPGSEDVYVYQVDSIAQANGLYNMTCTVYMYKYLGYDSIPIHLLGTEAKGRDLLKYAFAGLRTSLLLGIVVSAINILIGIIWGSISGYFGGAVDIIMERITDVLSGLPWIILMTVLTLKLGSTFFVFGLALCLTGWIGTESVTRSQFYRYRDREYVLAAKTLGAKAPRLIFRHILPNAIGTIVTSSVLMIPSVVFNEATISYLGLGLKNLASLGVILSDTQPLLSVYPYQLLVPAIIISLLMICFNLFGNGLRDAFNPSLKGAE